MKRTIEPNSLKYLILGAGGLGLALRAALYATGIDGRGLLEAGHWAHIALWTLTVVTTGIILLSAVRFEDPSEHASCYPVSFAGAIGAFAAMAGIGLTTLREFSEFSSRLHLIIWVLGLASTAAMGLIGVCRLRGRTPHFLLHTAICIYFALRVVSQYQRWSSDPQLQDYCFYLIAYVALMLTAYHHAAFDTDLGRHKHLWFFSLSAVYLCCVSLSGNMDTVLLFGCGLWAFTNLTNPKVLPCSRCAQPDSGEMPASEA